MQLLTPASLHYPITVTKLLCSSGADVNAGDVLFTYEYKSKVDEYDDEKREYVERTRSLYSDFQSEYEGRISSLRVRKGDVLRSRSVVAEIEESCRHETQFGGICADCGKDMTFVQYNSTSRNTDRATVNTAHANPDLRVSLAQASKADEQAKRRLLNARKLSLVVDLDQTIIHATVDPTVAEWQKDPENPNYAAVKDVRAFQLMDDAPGARGCWYYIKLRPGLQDFLEQISKEYELHIYTMGTRAYAENIAKIIDPDRAIFGDRILSRDESGSMTAKNLKRLFPVDSKMVVIIDDRGDVWHWSPNLVKVVPYDFFVGIGDINSSFLPKRPELEAKPPKPAAPVDKEEPEKTSTTTSDQNSTAAKVDTGLSPPPQVNGGASAVDRLVSMAGNQDEGSIRIKTDEQDETIAQQLADRPLLQMQKFLDAKEEEAKASPAADAAVELLSTDETSKDTSPASPSSSSASPQSPPVESTISKYRHNLLQDDDNELHHLSRSLTTIHRLYFADYDRSTAGSKGGRVADIRHGGHSKKRSIDDLDNIPDAAEIMAATKRQVLADVHIVFSGVIPIGTMLDRHDTVIWARSFGATVSEELSRRTTHVIASPERRTAKVRQAAKKGRKNGRRVQIVSQGWLFACFTQWAKVDEGPFRIHMDAQQDGEQQQQLQPDGATNGSSSQALPDSFEARDEGILSSSDEEHEDDDDGLTEEESDAAAAATTSAATSLNGAATATAAAAAADAALEIDTDAEELSRYAPTTARDDVSPTGGEAPDYWDDINDELAEFLGSDADEDDSDDGESTTGSEATVGLRTPTKEGKKRKRATFENEAGSGGDSESGNESSGGGGGRGPGSRLQKKKREALARTSSLNRVTTVADSFSSSSAAATASARPDDPGPGTAGDEQGEGEEELDADLEAALAAEMEKGSDDDGGGEGETS